MLLHFLLQHPALFLQRQSSLTNLSEAPYRLA